MLKGRRLVAPAGLATRPTADRIKESVFNILGSTVQSTQVLDLFAGTGALGIEALSRGATHAVFIDQANASLAAIRSNIRNLGIADRTRVLQWNISKGLKCLSSAPQPFDLVFMDPPYESHAVAPTLAALIACGALAPTARIVIEHSVREPLGIPVAPLALIDQRRFGKTLVSFMDNMV
jgi:16S rRNA (guanine966-N2)-methyltransferase